MQYCPFVKDSSPPGPAQTQNLSLSLLAWHDNLFLWCKVALVNDYICMFFKRLLNLSARTDAKSHRLHLYAFSPKGVFRCFLKSPAWIDGKSQMVALVRFFQLSPQIVCPNRCKVALIAFEQFFTWGSFQMFSQIACLNRWKVANGCTCTLFSILSSNCALELMQSHIFCIFVLFSRVSLSVLNFPACTDAKSHWWHLYAFSPEWVWMSSNCLPVQMQSHIDCIWTIFHLPSFLCLSDTSTIAIRTSR